ncbi:hypothetical protein R6Z07M_003664 [Ovis aries]
MCPRLPRACGAEDEGCWRPRAVGMLRTERLFLAPEEWRISSAQTPQGAPCQCPPPGASRSWGVLVPSGAQQNWEPCNQAPHPREATAQLAWSEPSVSSVSCAS